MLLVDQLALCCKLFSPATAVFRFLVQGLGNHRRTTLHREFEDRNRVFFQAPLNTQFITGIERTPRFGAVTVEVHFTARNRLTRDSAGFKKPRCPEPLVQPC